MAVVAFVTVPGLAVLLVLLVIFDGLGLLANRYFRVPWRRAGNRPISAIGLDEGLALFHATKRYELDERQHSLMMRDEEGDSAPPRTEIDLDGGSAVIRMSARRAGGDA
jgi:hypothetical protein